MGGIPMLGLRVVTSVSGTDVLKANPDFQAGRTRLHLGNATRRQHPFRHGKAQGAL
jgi:hypothetical protein